jgi:hypothetical protein
VASEVISDAPTRALDQAAPLLRSSNTLTSQEHSAIHLHFFFIPQANEKDSD